jgi:hypothetical protein
MHKELDEAFWHGTINEMALAQKDVFDSPIRRASQFPEFIKDRIKFPLSCQFDYSSTPAHHSVDGP